MEKDKYIADKFGRDPGFSVPDGYFDSFFEQMPSKLPPYKTADIPEKMSLWQKVRPYVYFAAMFAGIWLMMNVFNHVSQSSRLSLDNPPDAVAIAMASSDPDEFGIAGNGIQDFELIDEIADSYDNISDFEDDFDYEFKPEFRDMPVYASGL